MTDNELFALIISVINAGLVVYDLEDVLVLQSNQPTQQGAPLSRFIKIYKVSDLRYGFLSRKNEFDALNSQYVHTESQQYESTFQVSAFAIQTQSSTTELTASDLANIASSIMQSDATLETLNDSDVGILRIQPVLNPQYLDDMDRNEAASNFDFTLSYARTKVTTVPIADVEGEIIGV